METTLKTIQSVPLVQIRPSRNNPRQVIRQEMIDARAASMAQSGQATPIKLRPLTPEEGSTDTLYEIIDGELRYRAALKNGWKDIEAQILDMTPEQAFEEAIRSNRINMPGWFEDYLAMEQLEKAGKLKKYEIAALFEVDPSRIARALKITGVLNQPCRVLILENLQKSDSQGQISENALYRLADLGDAQAVEKALPRVLEGRMTEPQVKALVKQFQAGGGQGVTGAVPVPAQAGVADPAPSAGRGRKASTPAVPSGATKPKGTNPSPVGVLLAQVLEQVFTAFARRKGVYTSGWTGLATFGVILLLTTHWTGLFRWLNQPSKPLQTVAPVTVIQAAPVTNLSNPSATSPAVKVSNNKQAPNQPVTAANGSSANNIPQGQLKGFEGTQGKSPVKASTAGSVHDDPLKSIGDAVKDVSNAVGTAKQGGDAIDTVKKLLPF